MTMPFQKWLVLMAITLAGVGLQPSVLAQVVEEEPGLDKLLEETTGPDAAVKQFEDSNPDIRTAAEQFSQRKFVEASETLKQARTANPALPPTGVILGTWHARVNNLSAARAAFEVAARDDPNDPEAYIVFGESALRQRRVTDADLLFNKANSLLAAFDSNATRKKLLSVRSLSGIGAVAEMRGQWEKAETAFERLLGIDETNINGQIRLARAMFNRGEAGGDKEAVNEAYKTFQKVHKQEPEKVARPEINMARLYQQVGKNNNAEKLVQLAIERDKDGLATQLAAAQWGIDTGRMELVQSCLARAQEIDPTAIQVLLLEGFMARQAGDYAAAVEAFQKAQQDSPSSPVVLNQLAICLAEQDDKAKREQSMQYVELLLKVSGDRNQAAGREAMLTSAWVLHQLDRKSDAFRQVQLAMSAGGVSPDSAFFAAKILADNEQKDAAVALLESSVQGNDRLFPNRKKAEQLLKQLKQP